MNAVDTNVRIYFVDGDEPVKRATAERLLVALSQASIETVVPWQVLGEFVATLRRWERSGSGHAAATLAHLRQVRSIFRIVMPTENVLDQAMQLAEAHSLSHWDAMLLGACVEAGVTTLYSEDLAHGQTYGGVTVVNPFAS